MIDAPVQAVWALCVLGESTQGSSSAIVGLESPAAYSPPVTAARTISIQASIRLNTIVSTTPITTR